MPTPSSFDPYEPDDLIDNSQEFSFEVTKEKFYVDIIDQKFKLENLKSLQNDNRQRLSYAKLTFILTCVWISTSMTIVVCEGANILSLSEAVLITLISTTTANVFGFFFLVIKYLFRTKE